MSSEVVKEQRNPEVEKSGELCFDVESVRVVDAGQTLPDPGWKFPMHSHPHWEFIYFLRGSGIVDTPQGLFRAQTYSLIIYPPNFLHSERTNAADPQQSLYLELDVPAVYTPDIRVLPDENGEIGWLCERIVQETLAHGITPLVEAYCKAFLHLVTREWKKSEGVSQDCVDLAVKHISINFRENISLQELADVSHVSKSHLVHRFSARFGISPLRYLQKVRVESAKRLLVTTHKPVSEIARYVGYPDPLHFSRVFKRSTGMSPREFRSQSNSTI